MAFDDILIQIGQFGKYQRKQYFLLCLPGILCAMHQLASVFLAAKPDFRCKLPEDLYNGTDTYAIQNDYHQLVINTYINSALSKTNKTVYETCKFLSNDTCTDYVYSQQYIRNSITTDENLVCGDKIKATLSTMVYMFGVLAGAFFFGILSDFIGRKKTMLICLVLQGASGLASGLVPKDYYAFVALRFLTGGASMGLFMVDFVLGMELIGPKYRMVAGIVMQYFFALGYVLVAGIAYLVQEWQYLEIAMSAPSFIFLCYYWIVPESARWLLSKGRKDDAEKVVQNAAKVNGVTLPKGMFDDFEETAQTEKLLTIFKSPTLLIRSGIIFLNWFAIAMGYYGLSLNSGSLGGDIYLNFILGGLVEFPAYTVCFLCNKFGRKSLHVTGMMIGGLACLITVLLDLYARNIFNDEQLQAAFISLNMIGKFGMTIGFALIYLWSAEVFPTSLRNSLMGFSSTTARVGSIAAPLIIDLGDLIAKRYSRVMPAAIFGSLVILAGLLSIAIPETAGQSLPETIEEANNFPNHNIEKTPGGNIGGSSAVELIEKTKLSQ